MPSSDKKFKSDEFIESSNEEDEGEIDTITLILFMASIQQMRMRERLLVVVIEEVVVRMTPQSW